MSGRIVTVFRNRLGQDAAEQGYPEVAAEMQARARSMPGYVDFKLFVAADGERVAIIVFESLEQQRAWRDDPAHRDAQVRGRESFYSDYSISVCEEIEFRYFRRDDESLGACVGTGRA